MYVLPVFNLTCNVWTFVTNPPLGPPRISPVCNLAYGRRVIFGGEAIAGVADFPPAAMSLLLPKLTDIRGLQSAAGNDIVEVPAGSGRYYIVVYVDDIGKGFTNEHRIALITQNGTWPTPVP